MSTELGADRDSAFLALLAYQQLSMVESLLRVPQDELGDRLAIGRLAADALARSLRLCDAIPGGQVGAVSAMEPIVSPVDEFWTMTRPRVPVELWLRAAAVAAFELEMVQRVGSRLSGPSTEALAAESGLWRAIDHANEAVNAAVAARTTTMDELSLYARRLLGEFAVMAQRLVVRQADLRMTLTGTSDDELSATGELLDDLLGALADRLRSIGLSV